MLKGSTAVGIRWAGDKRTEGSAWAHQLAAVAAQGPAEVHTSFRNKNPQAGMKPQSVVSKWADYTFTFHVNREGVS